MAVSTPSSPARQIRHVAGLAALMDWMDRWRHAIGAIERQGQVIYLGERPSERFAIALPRRRVFGRAPSLLFQPEEAEWGTQIRWARVQQVKQGLALVAQRQVGAGDLPTLPAFAIVIQLRGQAAEVPFEQVGRVDLRKLWCNEGQWQVEGGNPFQALGVTPSNDQLLSPDDLREGVTFKELVRQRALRGAQESQPTYRGDAAPLSSLSREFMPERSTSPSDPELYGGSNSSVRLKTSARG